MCSLRHVPQRTSFGCGCSVLALKLLCDLRLEKEDLRVATEEAAVAGAEAGGGAAAAGGGGGKGAYLAILPSLPTSDTFQSTHS